MKKLSPNQIIKKLDPPLWMSFWFESNASWGWVKNKEDWEERKKDYRQMHTHTPNEHFKQARRFDGSTMHNFGFRHEHKGKEILGEFFDKHQMEI